MTITKVELHRYMGPNYQQGQGPNSSMCPLWSPEHLHRLTDLHPNPQKQHSAAAKTCSSDTSPPTYDGLGKLDLLIA